VAVAVAAVVAPSTSATASGAAVAARWQAAPVLPKVATDAGPVPADQRLSLSVTMPSRDPVGLSTLASSVSDPRSPDYRHYLTARQFSSRFGAAASVVGSLRQTLRGAGLQVTGQAGDGLSLTVSATAQAASRFFSVNLHRDRVGSRLFYANQGPARLPAGAEAVLGLDDLVRATHGSVGSTSSVTSQTCPTAGSGSAYVPAQVAQAYGMDNLYGQGLTGAGITVASFELADYAGTDIAVYTSCFGGNAANVSRVLTDSGAPLGQGTSEATADIENLLGMAPGVRVLVYEAPDSAQGIYDNYAAIVSQDQAQVVSTSWGQCEAEMPAGMAQAENTVFQEAAVQGQSVVAASGDSGSEDCYYPGVDNDTSLAVDDPASQPYVTGVGGTSLQSISPRSESAWNSGGGAGGGGISSVWPMPAYQRAVVGPYSTGAPCGISSGWCREVPDVSASADVNHGYYLYCDAADCAGAGWTPVGGTSLASPLWASLVALSDQACPAGPAGFLNPALYANRTTATNDITSGNNDLTGTTGRYPATTGYDMATGLGSPVAAGVVSALCAAAASRPSQGYRMVASDGGIFDYGSASFYGSTGAERLNRPVVGMAATPDGKGYWLVASDGGIFTFGDAGFFGSTGAERLNQPIVGMAATPDGKGYWLVASDGGIFTFGDAGFHGSAGGSRLGSTVVGMAADPETGGYWLVTGAGAVLAYGAPYFGSPGALTAPVAGLAASPDGAGYRLAGRDGNVYAFGDATYLGGLSGRALAKPVVGIADSPDGYGYWMVGADGGIFSFGDAGFLGSAGAIQLSRPIVGLAVG
jgi:hypothetical protein